LRQSPDKYERPFPGTEDDSRLDEPADDRPDPEDLARIDEQRALLERAVAALRGQDRVLYELRFVDERSYKEISDSLGITVNNVGVSLSRLVDRLRASVTRGPSRKTRDSGTGVRSGGPSPSPR
jgi:RNA polymerase sigma factor (sigma-70 family)